MVTALSFDAGGVIVHPNWVRVADVLRAHGVDAEASALEAAEPHAKRRFDNPPTISATNDASRGWLYFNLVLEKAGIATSPATDAALEELKVYHTETNLWEYVTPGAARTLAALRERGMTMIVTSNANGRLHALFDRLGLSPYFDVIVDSFLEGVEKPDPRLFRTAARRAGVNEAATLHIGDLYHVDVVGARAAGMQQLLIDAADLYGDADCPRVRTINELPAFLDERSGH
jgi:putative hydrolase of the HAD superfamily